MFFAKVSPHTGFGQHGPVGQFEGAALERGDDGIAHVADEDCHGRHGDQGPNDEKWFASVGRRREVTISDGEQRDIAEVERLEI